MTSGAVPGTKTFFETMTVSGTTVTIGVAVGVPGVTIGVCVGVSVIVGVSVMVGVAVIVRVQVGV